MNVQEHLDLLGLVVEDKVTCRLIIINRNPVMDLPNFMVANRQEGSDLKGPAEKPLPERIYEGWN
jgi:hypothetical protein